MAPQLSSAPDGRVRIREDHLPLTAKKALEVQNLKLPNNLKKIIEIVYEGVEPQGAAFGPEQPKARAKPGPKPKNLTV